MYFQLKTIPVKFEERRKFSKSYNKNEKKKLSSVEFVSGVGVEVNYFK